MTVRRTFAVVAAIASSLAAGGCPPPPDVGDVPKEPPPATSGESEPSTPSPKAPEVAAPVSSPGAPVPRGTDTSAPVVYEKVQGGTSVPRCPQCGTVQAANATRCPACAQVLSSWRHEELCTRCAGDGACDHCGDDRVCLACDGDGRCSMCGGAGELQGGGKCPECAGSRNCISCLGDGRREAAARDFAPSEGAQPGACGACIDSSGLCPDCGSSGKDRLGGTCATCGGAGVCPECRGEGTCVWCAADGECPQCEGGGVLVRNGAPRGPDVRLRRLRTAAGSSMTGRVAAPPAPSGLRFVTEDKGRATTTTLPPAQLDPLSWILAIRDFPPGWDGRTNPEPGQLAKHRFDLAQAASDASAWSVAQKALRDAISLDPARAQEARVRLTDLETRRADAWTRRAEEAVKAGDRDRAIVLLEMVAFRARGLPASNVASLRVLGLRKDRETEAAKVDDGAKARLASEGRAFVERSVARAKFRLQRAQRLSDRAAQSAADDPAADRVFARAEQSAFLARRIVQLAAARQPSPDTAWPSDPASFVTESRRVSASVLESWSARAVSGGRFALAARLARRAIDLDPGRETVKNLLAQAESGLARDGVLSGSPPPSPR